MEETVKIPNTETKTKKSSNTQTKTRKCEIETKAKKSNRYE